MTITGVKKILHDGSFGKEMADVKQQASSSKSVPQMSVQDKDDIELAISLLEQAKSVLE